MPTTEAPKSQIESATSKDGTRIGYRRFGQGPGLVVLNGAMSSAHNHIELAAALGGSHTVYLADRRGRGASGPRREGHRLQTDVEDLDAVLTETGASDVFGVSSGGIICLEAALTLTNIRRAAIFEPPLFPDRATPNASLARFDREMDRGKTEAAMITAMKGAEMGPALMRAIPSPLLVPMVKMAIRGEEKKGTNGYLSMRELAPTLHADLQIAVEASGDPSRFGRLPAEVLLLGGSKSPAYLKAAVDSLASVLPGARRVELPDVGHEASWNEDRGGKPAVVAAALQEFLASPGAMRST
jgi:pimeloyl-ACP methyl ester carboxylesterase